MTTTDKPKARAWDGVVIPFIPSTDPACQGASEATTAESASALEFQRKTCVACPVLMQCARHALNHEPYGQWGLTESQRYDLGGVVPSEWADMVPNPERALDELEASGVPLSVITQIVQATGPRNQVTFHAIAGRKAKVVAENMLVRTSSAVEKVAA